MNSYYRFQKTIANPGSISGIGLHTGQQCQIGFYPAPEDSGIQFYTSNQMVCDLRKSSQHTLSGFPARCSSIGEGSNKLLTVEHFLAALVGLGITNLRVDFCGPEVPGVDGSALPFVTALKKSGLVIQSGRAPIYKIEEPIFCYDKLKAVCLFPAQELSVSYLLDYDTEYLRHQKAEFVLSPEIFEREIAPARTFCTEKEAAELRSRGLGLGATRENTIVVDPDGVFKKKLRFEDECARHKVLDILGDLALFGFPVQGRFSAIRSGHALNQSLVQKIKIQRGVES